MRTDNLVTWFSTSKICVLFVTVIFCAVLWGDLAYSQLNDEEDEVNISNMSGTVERPKRHFRLRNPMRLGKKDSARIYENIKDAMRLSYSDSGHEIAGEYLSWKLINNAPYLSTAHGNHYLNNYINDKAGAYLKYEQAGVMPEGAIIAKDSFSVTETREIILGALFVMEKMQPGFNHVTDDWKYVQIQSDGTLLGETNGKNSERVEYCILCHLARKQYDHLYFIPEEYRSE